MSNFNTELGSINQQISNFDSALPGDKSGHNILEASKAQDTTSAVRREEKGKTKDAAAEKRFAEDERQSNPQSGQGKAIVKTDLASGESKSKVDSQAATVCRKKIADETPATSQSGSRDNSTRCSFLPTGKSMPVHMLHPHPHRRHYPHHLLDHFSRDLSHQSTASATWDEVIPAGRPATAEASAQDTSDFRQLQEASTGGRDSASADDNRREPIDSNNNPTPITEEQSGTAYYTELQQESTAWPFFGAESRVLPSGRRVSFLKQACLGFTSSNTARDKNDNMETICPKAFREASFTPRRSFLRSGDGGRVAELRRRFTDMATISAVQNADMNYANLNRFKYETVKGPRNVTVETPPADTAKNSASVITGSVIIDSSSTKGNHPVPKAPGLRSPNTPVSDNKPTVGAKPKQRVASPTQQRTAAKEKMKQTRPPAKSTSPSPTRQKGSPSPTKTPSAGAFRGPRIVKPESKPPQLKQTKPPLPKTKPAQDSMNSKPFRPPAAFSAATKKDNLTKKDKERLTRVGAAEKPPSKAPVEKVQTTVSSPSDSLEEGSSLVMVKTDGMDDEDTTSTYEELSNDASVISDRNFLVDYGDPSRFYFRNEWEARMRGIDEDTARMKVKLRQFCRDEKMLAETIEVIDEVGNIKQEMEELYDYFDHFEREEDTLLQQVQRQLVQANKYCKVLQYRLEKAEKHQNHDKRIKELEEELKLSRQVAVSLHWELQATDSKQAKLEQENDRLRHDLLAAETAKQAIGSQVEKLHHEIDQLSLHAPSKMEKNDTDEVVPSDTTSEMKRQIQFMEEKEEIMLGRLVDLQKEKDSLKDELEKYRDQYGELASDIPTGTSRQTDLKLRLKLAEDQAGLLARKIIDLQLENDNMVKLAAEKELMAKEVIQRNASVSDLQFLEDERESLRLALDEMEIENQKLAAELLRYKQAVHRQLHSNSSSTESPLDVGVMIRVPRSSESVFDEDGKISTKSYKYSQVEDKSASRQDSLSEHATGDRNKLRLSLTSPLNQSQKRSKMSLSRTLSDIAIPLSPDTKSSPQQTTPNQATLSGSVTPGPKSHMQPTVSNSRRSSNAKSKKSRKVKMMDKTTETDHKEEAPTPCKKCIHDCTRQNRPQTRSQASSPIMANIQSLLQPAIQLVNQMRKTTTKSEATSPVRWDSPNFPSSPSSHGARSHNALLDDMRRQLACVRNIAESMDTVVDVEEMEAELERKGKAIVDAECRRIKERSEQKRKIAKMAKSLQKHIKDMETSVSVAEGDENLSAGASLAEVAGWDLHGNAEVTPTKEEGDGEMSTLAIPSSSTDEIISIATVRSFASTIRTRSVSEITVRAFEGIVLVIIAYLLLTSLPSSALIQICFLLVVFFVC